MPNGDPDHAPDEGAGAAPAGRRGPDEELLALLGTWAERYPGAGRAERGDIASRRQAVVRAALRRTAAAPGDRAALLAAVGRAAAPLLAPLLDRFHKAWEKYEDAAFRSALTDWARARVSPGLPPVFCAIIPLRQG